MNTSIQYSDHQLVCDTWILADLLVAYLKQLNISYVFGIPGGGIEPLYDALARSERSGGPRAVVSRHETGAVFMAEGYGTHLNKLGVCCATTGPGTTNLITGVASAYANNIPLLVITAQTTLKDFGRNAFQESSCTHVNTIGMMEHCTLYNTLVSHPDQLEHKLITAIVTAFGSPSGPVHLSIPFDIMKSPCVPKKSLININTLLRQPLLYDPFEIDKLEDNLSKNKPVVFIIGNGAKGAIEIILSIAALINAKIIATPHGKGLINSYNPLFYGVIGFGGHESAADVLKDPELNCIICIGTILSQWGSNGWDEKLILNNKLIHVDQNPTNFHYSPMAKMHVHGNIREIFQRLYKKICSKNNHDQESFPAPDYQTFSNENEKSVDKLLSRNLILDDENVYSDSETPIKPQSLMRHLPHVFPQNTQYLADVGGSFAWSIHYLHPVERRKDLLRNPEETFRTCVEFAPMGWAIGCAVGTALADRNQPVVCITGDGSLLMNGQEITVAVIEKLPIIFIVLNDSCLGMARHGQIMSGAEQVGTDICFTDFSSFAKSMGADAYVIHNVNDLKHLDIKGLLTAPRPTLLDVRIDTEACPPIGIRIKGLS